MADALEIAIQRMFPETFITAHPGIVAERKRALERADPACFRTACVALARLDLAPVLKLIRNPTVVMGGALDQTKTPGLARELAAGLGGVEFLERVGAGVGTAAV